MLFNLVYWAVKATVIAAGIVLVCIFWTFLFWAIYLIGMAIVGP